jgi:hypothetical protein
MGIEQECPACGSTHIRVRRARSLLDDLLALRGTFPAHCDNCSARFRVRDVELSSAKYAHCPRCLRQDLSTWDLRHYHATLWMQIRMLLGAHRWRCEVCRCNFVSFRPRKEKYVRPAERPAPGEDADSGGSPS